MNNKARISAYLSALVHSCLFVIRLPFVIGFVIRHSSF